MIKILKEGVNTREEIFCVVEPKVNVDKIVEEILENVKTNGDKALYEYAFSQYAGFTPSDSAYSLPVVGGTASTVALIKAGTVYKTLPKDHGAITARVELPRFLYAGFAEGTRVGQIVYECEGQVLGTLPLLTATAVPKRTPHRTLWQRLKNLLTD